MIPRVILARKDIRMTWHPLHLQKPLVQFQCCTVAMRLFCNSKDQSSFSYTFGCSIFKGAGFIPWNLNIHYFSHKSPLFILALSQINPLTPNDHYSGRTASLTSKRCILYIYSKNIGTEYFKHGIYSPCFSLQNAVCFIILTYLVSVLFTFYIIYKILYILYIYYYYYIFCIIYKIKKKIIPSPKD